MRMLDIRVRLCGRRRGICLKIAHVHIYADIVSSTAYYALAAISVKGRLLLIARR